MMILNLPFLMIIEDYSEADHRASAERFVRHMRSDKAIAVLRKWGNWLKSTEGRSVLDRLGELADELLCGDITPAHYALALIQLELMTPVPQGDLEVLARHVLEFCRCSFFGAGNVPNVDIKPADYVGDA